MSLILTLMQMYIGYLLQAVFFLHPVDTVYVLSCSPWLTTSLCKDVSSHVVLWVWSLRHCLYIHFTQFIHNLRHTKTLQLLVSSLSSRVQPSLISILCLLCHFLAFLCLRAAFLWPVNAQDCSMLNCRPCLTSRMVSLPVTLLLPNGTTSVWYVVYFSVD